MGPDLQAKQHIVYDLKSKQFNRSRNLYFDELKTIADLRAVGSPAKLIATSSRTSHSGEMDDIEDVSKNESFQTAQIESADDVHDGDADGRQSGSETSQSESEDETSKSDIESE